MAKAKVSKKRRRRHLKKNVRWTIAGLMMATAIVIALIPVQGGGVSAFNSTEDNKSVKVDVYDMTTLLGTTHKTGYSKNYVDESISPAAYKAYLINGTIPKDTYKATPTDLYGASCEDDENLGTVSVSRTKYQQSNDGGANFSALTAEMSGKELYTLSDTSGNPIGDSGSAVQLYTLDASNPRVVANYIGNGSSLELKKYSPDNPNMGVGYMSASQTDVNDSDSKALDTSTNNKNRFYAVRTLDVSKSVNYDVVYVNDTEKPIRDEEGNPVLDEYGNQKYEQKLDVTATNANRTDKINELKTQFDAMSDTDFSQTDIKYVLYDYADINEIADKAFFEKTVPSYDLSNSNIVKIGDGAFANSSSNAGTDLKLPATIEKIGTAAFHGVNATTLEMSPNNAVEIGCAVFANSKISTGPDGSELTLNKVTAFKNVADHVTGPTTKSEYPDELYYQTCGAFANCENLQYVSFPDLSGKVPRGTFGNDFNLQYVSFGNNGTGIVEEDKENEFGQTVANNPYFYIWGKYSEPGAVSDLHKYAFKNNIPYRYDDGNAYDKEGRPAEMYSFLNDDGYIYDVAVDKNTREANIESIKKNTSSIGTSPSVTMNVPYNIGGYPINGINKQAAYGLSGVYTINFPVTLQNIGEEAFRQMPDLEHVNFTFEKKQDGLDSVGNPYYFNDAEDQKTSIGKYCFQGCSNLKDVNFKTFDYVQQRNRCCMMGDFDAGAFYTGGSGKSDLKFISKIPEAGTEGNYGQYNYCINTNKVHVTEELEMVACTFNADRKGILYETDIPELISFRYLPDGDNGKGVVSLINYPTYGKALDFADGTGKANTSKYPYLTDTSKLLGYKTVGDAYEAYVRAKSTNEDLPGIIHDIGECFETIEIPAGVKSVEGTKDKIAHPDYTDADGNYHAIYNDSYFRDLDGTKNLVLRGIDHLPEGAFATTHKPSATDVSTLEKVEFYADVLDLGQVDKDYTPFYDSINVNNVSFFGEPKDESGNLLFSNDDIAYAYDKGVIYGYGTDKEGDYAEIVECLDMRGISAETGDDSIPSSAFYMTSETDPLINTISRVGKKAFENNNYMRELDFSATSLKYLKADSFKNCGALRTVKLPTAFKRADDGGHFSYTNAVDVYCPNTQASFPLDSFKGNEGNPTVIHGYDEPEGLKEQIDGHYLTNKSAVFAIIDQEFTVRFLVVNPDNDTNEPLLIEAQTKNKGESADDPSVVDMSLLLFRLDQLGINLDKWKFRGWNTGFSDLKKDVDVFALLGPKDAVVTYNVTFTYADPTGKDTTRHGLDELDPRYIPQIIEKGKGTQVYPSDSESKGLLNSLYDGYIFNGWLVMGQKVDPATACLEVNEDLNFTVDWIKTDGPFDVTFKYKDPTGVDKTVYDFPDYSPQSINYGDKAKIPNESLTNLFFNNKYDGYTFTGWTPSDYLKECDNVTKPLELYAVFEKNQTGPKATFMDHDGTVLHTEYVAVGSAPVGPTMKPSRDGYTFAGWKPDLLTPITADTTYIAQYTANPTPPPGPTSSSETTTTPSSSTPSTSSGSSSDKTSSSNKSSSSSSTNKSSSSSSSSSMKPVVISGAPTPVVQPGTGASAAPGSSTAGTASSSSNVKTGNTNVVSTAPGLTNNGKMSATVNGSSDNYVVKITQTSEAENSAKEALSKNFGSLDNIKYMPFDISLYDSTGNKKIENVPAGVTVSVTMPIPDDLAVYGGNNKVASTTGGVLEPLQPRFTVIDGVPCMNYTVSHFSPYVVYVDTANLTATGTLDSTPKTADPIHPKWFLCIGLAALSIMLFLKRDKESLRAA